MTVLTDPEAVAKAIDLPVEQWAHQCHGVSMMIVRAGLVPGGRVARGTCPGVGGQHSWIVDGRDCYDPKAKLIDPTLWSYVDGVPILWHGSPKDRGHEPHGAGRIWDWGKPTDSRPGPALPFPKDGLSSFALTFLEMIEPLNESGWMQLFSYAPVQGWPARELMERAVEVGWGPWIPIDRLGMVTELNPQGLYW